LSRLAAEGARQPRAAEGCKLEVVLPLGKVQEKPAAVLECRFGGGGGGCHRTGAEGEAASSQHHCHGPGHLWVGTA